MNCSLTAAPQHKQRPAVTMARVDDTGRERLGATVAVSPHPRPMSQKHGQTADVTAAWRGCNLEGYLERKLHRQWRNRGS